MSQDWSTSTKDLKVAEVIIESYAKAHNLSSLSLFEIVFDPNLKKLDYQLSPWVKALAIQFKTMYGEAQGETVTRNVVSRYLTEGQTIH
jgi:hypothetical protein